MADITFSVIETNGIQMRVAQAGRMWVAWGVASSREIRRVPVWAAPGGPNGTGYLVREIESFVSPWWLAGTEPPNILSLP